MIHKKIYISTRARQSLFQRAICSKRASMIVIMYSILTFLFVFFFLNSKNSLVEATIREGNPELLIQTEMNVFGKLIDFSDIMLITKLKNSNFKNCKFCRGIMKDEESASTEDDLAIAVLYGKLKYNVLTWVRTLRSTGCKCNILFLIEKGYLSNYNKNEIDAFIECGVTFWQTIDISSSKLNDKRVSKEIVFLDFFDKFGHLFRNIMISDVFDTVFQKDPFRSDIPHDKIAMSVEKVQFGNHDWNMNWVNQVDRNFSYNFYRKKWVINSGFKLGPPDKMLKLYEAAFLSGRIYGQQPSDQSLINYLYYRGIFNDLWVDYKAEHYSSACYSIFELKGDKNNYIHERKFPMNTPTMIHQFDRICPVIEHFARVCPAIDKWHEFATGRPNYLMQVCNSYFSYNNPKEIL